ncbi:MAG: hypothetical protein ACK2UL_05580 [Anaerolineae bacterium]
MAFLARQGLAAAIAVVALLPLPGSGNVTTDGASVLSAAPLPQRAASGSDPGPGPSPASHPPAVSGSAALGARLALEPRGRSAAHPPILAAVGAGEDEDGSRAVFWAWDFYQDLYYLVRAELVFEGEGALIYVEHGAAVSEGAVKGLGALFEESVLPGVRTAYGNEPRPGIDGIDAVTILMLDVRDPLYYGAEPYTYYSGYFDPVNERRQAELDLELPYYRSNEREMIYLDTAPTVAGGEVNRQTMAHELAHLVLWFMDPEEEEWLAEGLSELAVWLSGLGHPREHITGFLASPDVSLTSWVGDVRDYGKVYLFMLYTYEQAADTDTGADTVWLRQLAAHPGHGLASLRDVLPVDRTLVELLRDFAVAIYRDVPTGIDSRLGFESLDLADAPVGEQFMRPAPAVRRLAGMTAGEVELAPWSWKGLEFAPGNEAVDLEIVPDSGLCIGWYPAVDRRKPGTRCLGPGEAMAWPMATASGGGEPLQVFVANGLPLANRAAIAAAPHAAAQGGVDALYVPLAIVR